MYKLDITLGKIAGAIPVLQQIKSKKPSFKVDYWLMRNIKLYVDSYNFFIQKREEIFEKYCDKIINEFAPEGSYYTLDINGTIQFNLKPGISNEEFQKDMDELMKMPCDDIVPYKLSLEVINNSGDFSLDNEDDIFAIDYLLTE